MFKHKCTWILLLLATRSSFHLSRCVCSLVRWLIKHPRKFTKCRDQCLPTYLTASRSISLYTHLPTLFYISTSLSSHYIYLPIYPSIYLSVSRSIYLSMSLSLSFCPPVWVSLFVFLSFVFVYLPFPLISVLLSLYPFTGLSFCLCLLVYL